MFSSDVLNSFNILSDGGKGATGAIFIAQHHLHSSSVAIKVVDKNNGSDREIKFLRDFDHPFMLHIFQVYENGDKYNMVLENCTNGSIKQFIIKNGVFKEENAKIIIGELACALKYANNKNGFVHRDIKLDNILLDKFYHVRIADFGMSNNTSNDKMLYTACGSPSNTAPEVILRQPYNFKADIWSLGIVTFCLLTGKYPFQSDNLMELFRQIINDEPTYPSFLSPEAIDFLNHLLTKKQNERYDYAQLLNHPWMEDVVSDMTFIEENLSMFSMAHSDTALTNASISANIEKDIIIDDLKKGNPSTGAFIYKLNRIKEIEFLIKCKMPSIVTKCPKSFSIPQSKSQKQTKYLSLVSNDMRKSAIKGVYTSIINPSNISKMIKPKSSVNFKITTSFT